MSSQDLQHLLLHDYNIRKRLQKFNFMAKLDYTKNVGKYQEMDCTWKNPPYVWEVKVRSLPKSETNGPEKCLNEAITANVSNTSH